MGRMIFDLTDEDRAALERVRGAMGLRSQAEVLRWLIKSADERLPSGTIIGVFPSALDATPVRDVKVTVDPSASFVTRAASSIQLGPSSAAPGSRLKGAKK